jgi:two-component system response regulator MtrA
MVHKVLVVEDEELLNRQLCDMLETAGYEAVGSLDGVNAMLAFKSFNPDLVLLDIQLPPTSGIEVCKEIRALSGVPVIMLTAKTNDEDVVAGLEAGADDYIFKPMPSFKVLQARIEARLRPAFTPEVNELVIGPLVIDVLGHEVRRDGVRIALTPLEFNLLQTLAEAPKQVFKREDLLKKVWGYHYDADTRLVNVHVQRLRSKIEDDPDNPKIVVTERGVGYKAGQF